MRVREWRKRRGRGKREQVRESVEEKESESKLMCERESGGTGEREGKEIK